MENRLEKEVFELIRTLQLPELVLEIFNGNISDPEIDELMKYNYSKPESILELTDEERKTYQVDQYKPILNFNSYQILAYDVTNKGFFLYDLEEDIDEPNLFTWDGVWLDEVSFWWENEWSDDEIRKVAKALNLKHVDEIIKSLEENDEEGTLSTFEEKDAWLNKMINKYEMRVR